MVKAAAIVGGGPAALMVTKRLLEVPGSNIAIHIFESTDRLGQGMPYSSQGAGIEHVTNVSGDELPDLVTPLTEWVRSQPASLLQQFGVDGSSFHKKKVLPRLLFGRYLSDQFASLLLMAQKQGKQTVIHLNTRVVDIKNLEQNRLGLTTDKGQSFEFDYVVICSGHHWPGGHEGVVPGYFDAPYPPAKLNRQFDHTVAVQGSSLTAIDAIRTLARHNGHFVSQGDDLNFIPLTPHFRVEMHSRHGLLPCVRVHMQEPHTAANSLLDDEQIKDNIAKNGGFLDLDFVFARAFVEPLAQSDPELYSIIKEMNLETFVASMMRFRENIQPFELLQKEYLEATSSIKYKKPVYWKEILAQLSFALNYPAKYLCAEDMLRLQKTLMPLISVVIAFVPQNSCLELLALYRAGCIDLIADDDDAQVLINDKRQIVYHFKDRFGIQQDKVYESFIDCTGQPHLSIEAFPFKSLLEDGTISPAHVQFRSDEIAQALIAQGDKKVFEQAGSHYLTVPGASISDNFELVTVSGAASKNVFLMAVPYMGGFNPDYSGLDFCERASQLIVSKIIKAG